jgi:hypothetical protein
MEKTTFDPTGTTTTATKTRYRVTVGYREWAELYVTAESAEAAEEFVTEQGDFLFAQTPDDLDDSEITYDAATFKTGDGFTARLMWDEPNRGEIRLDGDLINVEEAPAET